MTSADVRKAPLQRRHAANAAAMRINSAQRSFAGICRHFPARYGRSPCSGTAQNHTRNAMSKDGLCAIVTGSASGLGAATAAILAKGGARIVINYSSSQKEAEQTADLCRSAGGEVAVVQGDVSRDEDCRRIVAAAAPWGRLDALINNAGTTKHMAHDNLDGLVGGGFSAAVRRQHHRAVPDGAGREIACWKPARKRRGAPPRSSTCRRSPASAASALRSPMPRARAR